MKTVFPAKSFLPYQQRWLEDNARFKIGLWARQTGKDYTCAAEAVADCLERQTHWVIVAAGERQARESLEKAREWVERLNQSAVCKTLEITFPSGSRITALPGKPETVRGYSANVILTEFAFHDDPAAIWRAAFPMVSNQLRGGEKKLRVITTPNGQGNFFHRLWLNQHSGFSRHRVTMQEAKDQGLPIDLDQLKRGLGDPEAWAQEYECAFLDGSMVLLPYSLIESCEAPEATETSTPQLLSTLPGELFAGIDFGRSRDLTVCWLLERVGRTFITREVLALEKMPVPAQLELLRPRVQRARRVCLDYTGSGVGLGDLLAAEFGALKQFSTLSKIELCHFTSGLKQELFPTLRAAFERALVRIPASSVIREDLHGVHKFVSGAGEITYRAGQRSDGHSDRCTALALALRAALSAPALSHAASIDCTPGRR